MPIPMISAILSKLLASVFKAVSYGRFLKLAISCLDVSFCLLSGMNLIRLIMSATGLFMVNPSGKWVFLICLFTRELVVIVLLYVVFEKAVNSRHKLDVYRCGAYLFTLIGYTLAKYSVQIGSLAMQTVLFQSGMVGFSYTLVLLSRRLYLLF
jgi:hypothetical protein